VGTELTVRDQASLFALMVVARPVTNRELRDLAGLQISAEVRRRAFHDDRELIATKKRGAVNTHKLTAAGVSWCESALAAGRPDGTKFPAGVLYAVLDSVGQYLARSGTKPRSVDRIGPRWLEAAWRCDESALRAGMIGFV
jgi:hypothetical protein